MSEHWSLTEVEAAVADYFAMLARELKGENYNKSDHRRHLATLLNNRSNPSIERKHQNISAILNEAHFPWIVGYKPLGNYQQLLADAVLRRLEADNQLENLAAEIVGREAGAPPSDSVDFEEPPRHDNPGMYIRDATDAAPRRYRASHVDYFQREARNRSLGTAGEEFVVHLERKRLIREGAERLVDKVEWISQSKGDGAGFDVLSFEASGRERFIEVKTTTFGKETPFFVSRNEVSFSSDYRDQFSLYRVFAFRATPRLYALPGALENSCRLEANSFVGKVR